MSRCTAISGSTGEQCGRLADEGFESCLYHATEAERQEARRKMFSDHGRTGAAVQRERKEQLEAAAAQRIPLRSIEEITAYLESEAAAAKATSDPSRSNAAARIAKAAQDLLPIAKMEQENRELRALLIERNPELKAHPLLKAM